MSAGLLAAIALGAAAAAGAQEDPPPAQPNAVGATELGPLAPLTTGWHTIGSSITVPAAATLALRQNHSVGAKVTWFEATESATGDGWSVARYFTSAVGSHLIGASIQFPDGATEVVTIEVNVVATTPEQVAVDLQPLPEELLAASPTPLYGGDVVVPVGTPIALRASVQPPSLAGLVEWRFDGRRTLGSEVEHAFRFPGRHRIEVGPTNAADRVRVEAYGVDLAIAAPPKAIWDYGDPVDLAFVARTVPEGYEDHVQWTASTAAGYVTAESATGSSFALTVADYKVIEPCGETVYAVKVAANATSFEAATEDDPCSDPCDEEPVSTDG